jgi:DNA-binding CsgD family transcriptional regulator
MRRYLQAILLLCAQIAPRLEWARDQVRLHLAGLEHEPGVGARLLEAVLALDDARHLAVPAHALVARVQRTVEDGSLLSAEGGIAVGCNAAASALVTANPDVAISLVEKGLEAARRQGDVHSLAALRLHSCLARTFRGELPEAVADGTQGLELARTWGTDFALEWGSAFLAFAKLEAGDLDGAERLLSSAEPIGAELREDANSMTLLDGRMRLHHARGQFRACLDDTTELERQADALGCPNPAFNPWRSFTAVCLAALGEEPERARRLAAEEVELARRWGAPLALGAALRAQALVHDSHTGEQHLREAVEILDGSPARLEHAHALVELGALLRRDGQRTQARPLLRSGLDLARECGATLLAERAYHELRATGASPRKLTRTGLATLTPSELRVAQMAAVGKTNKQIAQELYVTVKTVEFHLAGAYRKLGITTRAELASKLGSGVPVSPSATAASPAPAP